MSKSRNEKKPPVQPPPITATNDIIPGKFNEIQWNSMVDQENGQNFILDIVDDIVDCTIKVIYDKYIESQLNPYTVEAAKDLLLQIIESRFLAHDIGEQFPGNDATWREDEEPVPCVTDAWSQGSVPVQRCLSRPLSARSDADRESLRETDPCLPDSREDETKVSNVDENVDQAISEDLSEEKLSLEPNVSLSAEIQPSPPSTAKGSSSSNRRRTGVKAVESRSRKQLKSKNTYQQEDEVSENDDTQKVNRGTIESTPFNLIGKVQTGRPPREAEVSYDEHGNIVAMMRLSSDKLPTHRIRTRFNIMDPNGDQFSNQVSRRLTSKENVLNQSRDAQRLSVLNIKKQSEKQVYKSPASFKSNHSLEVQIKDESVKALPPPLVDSMNISAGVVIREGSIVRKGPGMHVGPSTHLKAKQDALSLQPVGSLTKKQSISVSDVIGTTSPVIRQIRLPEPIPPIAPYSRS